MLVCEVHTVLGQKKLPNVKITPKGVLFVGSITFYFGKNIVLKLDP